MMVGFGLMVILINLDNCILGIAALCISSFTPSFNCQHDNMILQDMTVT